MSTVKGGLFWGLNKSHNAQPTSHMTTTQHLINIWGQKMFTATSSNVSSLVVFPFLLKPFLAPPPDVLMVGLSPACTKALLLNSILSARTHLFSRWQIIPSSLFVCWNPQQPELWKRLTAISGISKVTPFKRSHHSLPVPVRDVSEATHTGGVSAREGTWRKGLSVNWTRDLSEPTWESPIMVMLSRRGYIKVHLKY